MGSVCLKLVSPNSSGVISKMTTTSHRLGLSLATSPWPRLHWLLPEVSCTDEEFMVPAPSHSFSGPVKMSQPLRKLQTPAACTWLSRLCSFWGGSFKKRFSSTNYTNLCSPLAKSLSVFMSECDPVRKK